MAQQKKPDMTTAVPEPAAIPARPQNPDITAVVFDLDATLVNLGEHVDWRGAQRRAVEVYRFCGCPEEQILSCGGQGLFNLLSLMHSELRSGKPPEESERIQATVYSEIDHFEAEGAEKCTLMSGADEALRWLTGRGMMVGVCTSNSTASARRALQRLGIARYVSSVVGRSPKLRLKPSPDQVTECLRELGADPSHTVMIGDSHGDVLAGKAAGARTIAIPVYFTRMKELEAAKPNAIIRSLIELPAAILTLEEAAGRRTGSKAPD